MHTSKQNRQRDGVLGNHDRVNVVGHQRVSEQPRPGARQIPAQQPEVHFPIAIEEENSLAIGTALGYEWRFQLEGDELDARSVAELFGNEAKVIKDEGGRSHLVMNLTLTPDEVHAAQGQLKNLSPN